jgi:hypothetical protein
MLIRLRAEITGTRNGQPWPAKGSLVELPDDEAAALCKARLADPVASDRPPERAVPPTTAERRRRPRSTR